MSISRPWACVTDPANRVSLAVVRSLARAGVPVRLAMPDLSHVGVAPGGPAWASCHVRARLALPSPLDPAFAEALLAGTSPGETILPVSIDSLLAAAADHRVRSERRFPFASAERIRSANGKPWALSQAAALGLSVPRTLHPASIEEGLDLVRSVRYPCVVKVADDAGLFAPPASRYAVVQDSVQYRIAYRRLHAVKPFPVVQEYVPGEGWGVGVLYWKGRRIAAFCHRRLREYPASGGPASVAESVRDAPLIRAATTLFEGLAWEGVAQAEFRRDPATGRTVLLEINPRFWGTLPLAIRCGVDFPLLLYRLALGEEVRPVDRYPAGVRLRFAGLEMGRLARLWRSGPWGGARGAFRETLRFAAAGRIADGIADRADPAPSRAVFRQALAAAARGRFRSP